ncbi:MAG: hypothetical protein Kow0042_20410 [Calditrichia bacterium]
MCQFKLNRKLKELPAFPFTLRNIPSAPAGQNRDENSMNQQSSLDGYLNPKERPLANFAADTKRAFQQFRNVLYDGEPQP